MIRLKTLILSCLIILSGNNMATSQNIFEISDSTACSDSIITELFKETSFVIKGEMSPRWEGSLDLAVTDPIKNHRHTLKTTAGNRFECVVPMRGALQQIYLYVPGTAQIPVCAGDTITLMLDDDDMRLSSSRHDTDLDLKLASTIFRKMRKREYELNNLFNSYINESRMFSVQNTDTDSIKNRTIQRFREYNDMNKTLIDTFIQHHGTPRLEKYFRYSGFYKTLKWVSFCRVDLPTLNPSLQLNDTTSLPFNSYADSLLMYPDYLDFMMDYVNMAVSRINENSPSGADMKNSFKIRREISPSPGFADMANYKDLNTVYSCYGPDQAANVLGYVFETTGNREIKNEISGLMPDLTKLFKGEPAPPIALKDCDGKTYTLDNFKGKYLYLDFWDFGCKPCIEEFRYIPELKKQFGEKIKSVAFVTVCVSRPSKKKLEAFAAQHGMNELNLILDKKNSDSCYDVNLLPTYVLIDPDGRIVEFNTARPSEILKKAAEGTPTEFELSLN